MWDTIEYPSLKQAGYMDMSGTDSITICERDIATHTGSLSDLFKDRHFKRQSFFQAGTAYELSDGRTVTLEGFHIARRKSREAKHC